MRREKSRERKNNEERWKKQCAEQWKQSEIRASDQCPVVTPKDTDAAHETLTGGRELSAEFPDESERNSHTLIYAISTNSEHAQQANRVPGTGSRRTRTKGRAVRDAASSIGAPGRGRERSFQDYVSFPLSRMKAVEITMT